MAVAQVPLGIDHPLVTVNNHPQVLEHYRQMGFIHAPISYHPWGTVTTNVVFPSNFIELIGLHDASKFGTNSVNGFCFGRQLGSFLERGEQGISLVALHSQDADGDHARLSANGLHTQGRIDFRRAMTLPDGSPGEAVVSLGLFIDPELPDASNFICQQHRPELIWAKDWQKHPNGADAVLAVTYLADPELLLPRWQALYGERAQLRDGVLEVDTGCGVLRAIDAQRAAQEFSGVPLPTAVGERPHAIAIRVRTRTPETLRSILIQNQVPHHADADRVLVEPEFAGNVILELVSR